MKKIRKAASINADNLRKKAESLLKKGRPVKDTPSDLNELIHELKTHQIELEMQNEELRNAQTRLEEMRYKYTDLFEHAPIGYFTFDKNGIILEANLTACSMLGVEKNALIKKHFHSFVDKKNQDDFYLHRQNVLMGTVSQICEITLVRKDGSKFEARLDSVPVMDSTADIATRYRTTVTDITERMNLETELKNANENLEDKVKERTAKLTTMAEICRREVNDRGAAEEALRKNEEKYRELVESANSIILRWTADGKITFFNEFAQKFFGFAEKEVLGRNVVGTIVPEKEKSGRDLASMIIDIGKKPAKYLTNENENIRKNGERVWIAWTNKPIMNKNGKVVEILSVGIDATKRKLVEQERDRLHKALQFRVSQLRKLNEQLTQTEENERQRLAQVLHDHLQQLLVAAKLNVGMLSREYCDPNLLRELKDVFEILVKSIDITRSLAIELSPPILRQAGLAAALEWLSHDVMQKYSLKVNLEADAILNSIDQQCQIILFDVIRELLFNIVKHAKTKNAAIQAHCIDGQVKIEVKDKGVGFDVSKCQTETEASTFGLFKIRERIDLLGGHIEIDSAQNKGTTITLSIPLQRTAELKKQPIMHGQILNAESEMSTTYESVPADEQVGNIRVMLADDHKILRDGLADLLEQEKDIKVVAQAGDGKTAVELAEIYKPDVIIMDVSMPVLNGIEATRRIIEKSPGTKVIGLSMHDEAGMAAEMKKAGAVAYLAKTDASDNLVATIHSLAAGNSGKF